MIRFQRGRGPRLSVWLAGHRIRVDGATLIRAVAHIEERMKIKLRAKGKSAKRRSAKPAVSMVEAMTIHPKPGAGMNHMSVDALDAKGGTP
jgi:hypothetical protein